MSTLAKIVAHNANRFEPPHAANHHEVRLVQLCFDFYMIEAKPENLIGDRAYDSDPLDEELRNDGIEMIAPHRSNRSKPPTQDRRRLSRYMRRWLVERFFAWIQWQCRILVRWEYHAQNFLGFVQLAQVRWLRPLPTALPLPKGRDFAEAAPRAISPGRTADGRDQSNP